MLIIGKYVCGGVGEILVPSAHFCCEPQISPKIKSIFFLMPLREWKNRFIGGRDMWTFDSTILTGNWEAS